MILFEREECNPTAMVRRSRTEKLTNKLVYIALYPVIIV